MSEAPYRENIHADCITNQSYQMRRSWPCRYIPTHEYVYICTIEDGARCVLVPV